MCSFFRHDCQATGLQRCCSHQCLLSPPMFACKMQLITRLAVGVSYCIVLAKVAASATNRLSMESCVREMDRSHKFIANRSSSR